jgi:hypothetical protein
MDLVNAPVTDEEERLSGRFGEARYRSLGDLERSISPARRSEWVGLGFPRFRDCGTFRGQDQRGSARAGERRRGGREKRYRKREKQRHVHPGEFDSTSLVAGRDRAAARSTGD